MAKRCTRCGNFMMEDERFCPNCGENAQLPSDAAMPETNQANQYQQNYNYAQQNNDYTQQQYSAPPQYAAPLYPAPVEEMSLKKWVGTIVVTTFFGLISLIFLFIWAFGSGPESRRRYCQAMLITMLIGIGVSIVLSVLFFSVFAAIIGGIASELPRSNQSWDSVYAIFASFI